MGGTASKEQKGEQSSSENLTKSNFEITKEIFSKHVAKFPTESLVLSYTFNLFDIGHSNSIKSSDLQQFFKTVMDEEITDDEAEKMILKVTDGKSKEISYEYFEEFMNEEKGGVFKFKTFTMGTGEVPSLRSKEASDDFTPDPKQRNLVMAKSMNKKLTKQEQENDNLRRAFEIFDFSESGHVSLSDLIDLMKMMGMEISKEEVSTLFSIVNRRNHIDFHQFCELYKSSDYRYY